MIAGDVVNQALWDAAGYIGSMAAIVILAHVAVKAMRGR